MNEKATAEFEIEVSGGRIICEQVIPDGKYKVVSKQKKETTTNNSCILLDDVFVKVPAAELRLEDAFMQYQPTFLRVSLFKNDVETVIRSGLKDFWRPRCDPSFSQDGTGICYVPGNMPAVGKSYNWWVKVAKEFNPMRKSRLGTETEYVAFLAVLIKELVASGKPIEWAWNAVCRDSKELGHYANSEEAKYEFEPTGSRKVRDFCDLANTYKILAEDKDTGDFWLAGGCYNIVSNHFPLADLGRNDCRDDDDCDCTGWLVLEE